MFVTRNVRFGMIHKQLITNGQQDFRLPKTINITAKNKRNNIMTIMVSHDSNHIFKKSTDAVNDWSK